MSVHGEFTPQPIKVKVVLDPGSDQEPLLGGNIWLEGNIDILCRVWRQLCTPIHLVYVYFAELQPSLIVNEADYPDIRI